MIIEPRPMEFEPSEKINVHQYTESFMFQGKKGLIKDIIN